MTDSAHCKFIVTDRNCVDELLGDESYFPLTLDSEYATLPVTHTTITTGVGWQQTWENSFSIKESQSS